MEFKNLHMTVVRTNLNRNITPPKQKITVGH